MARMLAIALSPLLAVSFVAGQQAVQSAPASQTSSQNADTKVYVAGKDVTAPEFLPVDFTLPKIADCTTKASGEAVLSFLVDAGGIPRNIAFEEGVGNGLDGLAYKILSADRFKPGIHDGVPVTVPMEGELTLEACSQQTPSSNGDTQIIMRVRSQPRQTFKTMPPSQVELEFALVQLPSNDSQRTSDGKRATVKPPTPVSSAAAIYSEEARLKRINGVCLVSLTIDTEGKPHNVRVKRPLGYGLDQNAVEAVRKYRFKPATRNGTPMPVMITLEVGFRTY